MARQRKHTSTSRPISANESNNRSKPRVQFQAESENQVMGVNGMQSSVSSMHVATDSAVTHLFLEFRRISERFGRLRLFVRGATILFGFVLEGAFGHAVSMDVESTKGDVERKRRVPRSAPTERPRASNQTCHMQITCSIPKL